MPDKTKVSTGKPKVAGAVFSAAVGSTLPTDASTSLGSDFVDLGYLSEDGLTNKFSPTKENIKEWGGSIVATLQTEREDTFSFTLIESSNADVLKRVFGSANVTENSGAITVKATSADTESFAWVFDMILRNNRVKRIVVPSASITEVGDVSYVAADLISYNVTITAEVDATGATHYEYIA